MLYRCGAFVRRGGCNIRLFHKRRDPHHKFLNDSLYVCLLPAAVFSQFINKFCNKQIAVLMGCVAYEFIQIGFGQISSVKAFFTSDVYKVVEAAVLVLFLIYLNNEDLILRKRKNYA